MEDRHYNISQNSYKTRIKNIANQKTAAFCVGYVDDFIHVRKELHGNEGNRQTLYKTAELIL